MAVDPAPFSIIVNGAQAALRALPKPQPQFVFNATRDPRPQLIKLDAIEVDCTLSESYSYEADVTDFEVEVGSKISDHRRTNPVEFSISGIISDTPFPDESLDQARAQAQANFDGNIALLTDNAVISKNAFNRLEALYQRGDADDEPVTFSIVTKFRTFDSMVVKSLKISRESGTGLALPFTATFKQIRFVQTATGTIQGDPSLQNTAALGSQGGDEADPALAKKGADSIAFKTLDGKSLFDGALGRANKLADQRLTAPGGAGRDGI